MFVNTVFIHFNESHAMQRIIKYTQTVIFYNIRAEKNPIKINNNKKY